MKITMQQWQDVHDYVLYGIRTESIKTVLLAGLNLLKDTHVAAAYDGTSAHKMCSLRSYRKKFRMQTRRNSHRTNLRRNAHMSGMLRQRAGYDRRHGTGSERTHRRRPLARSVLRIRRKRKITR